MKSIFEMTRSVRAFVALELPEEVSVALEGVQAILEAQPATDVLRWVDPYTAHLTLRFLGEVPVDHLPGIVDVLDSVAERWKPFGLQLAALGAFPNVHRPNVLWVGVEEGEKAVTRLFNAVEAALKKLGIKPERSEFFPHVTLARLQKFASAAERKAIGDLVGTLPIPAIPHFTVASIALIRSELTSDGPEYTRLGNARFSEPPPLQHDEWEDEE